MLRNDFSDCETIPARRSEPRQPKRNVNCGVRRLYEAITGRTGYCKTTKIRNSVIKEQYSMPRTLWHHHKFDLDMNAITIGDRDM